MKKKSVISVIVVAMLLTVSLYFVGGTYARYANKFTATGKVSVAKWAVKVGEGGSETFDLTLTPTVNTDVVNGKIAPGSTATGEAEISLDGTEVAVEVKAEVDTEAIASNLSDAGFTTNAENIKATIKVEKEGAGTFNITGGTGTPYVISLPEGSGFTETDKLKATVTVTWDNDEDTEIVNDTAAGKQAATDIEIPVKLYIYQHITSEGALDTTKLDTP